jgi:hypothetical protein
LRRVAPVFVKQRTLENVPGSQSVQSAPQITTAVPLDTLDLDVTSRCDAEQRSQRVFFV